MRIPIKNNKNRRKNSKNSKNTPKSSLHKRKTDKIRYLIRKITKKYPKIKQKIKNIKDLDKKLYYAMVWEVTEQQPLYILENSDKRGWKNHHLDHIYPISMGYKEKIPPEKVGNIKNLRFIHYTENLDKGSKITNESRNALRRIKRLKK
jgi:predicted transcriptional regulator